VFNERDKKEAATFAFDEADILPRTQIREEGGREKTFVVAQILEPKWATTTFVYVPDKASTVSYAD